MNYSVSSSTHRPPIVWWASTTLHVENIHTWVTKVKMLSLFCRYTVWHQMKWAHHGTSAGMPQSSTTRTCEPGASALMRFFPCLPRRLIRCFVFLCRVVLFCSFDALVLRFEAPDSRNRWDSPLFTILKDDTLPCEAISDALFKRKAPPQNQSTQSVGLKMLLVCFKMRIFIFWTYKCFFFSLQQPLSSANFLYELDKITQDVLMVSVFVLSGPSVRVIVIPEQLYVKLKLTNTEKRVDLWLAMMQQSITRRNRAPQQLSVSCVSSQ